MTINDKKFIARIITDLIKNNITTIFKNTKILKDDQGIYSGYFSSDEKALVCASNIDYSEWFMILIHEYCHFLQWKNNHVIWKSMSQKDSDNFIEFLNGKIISTKKSNRLCDLAQNIEIECEKMVSKFICKYKLSLSIKQHIKKANAYLISYNTLKIKKYWWKKPPYKIKKIIDIMPDYFLKNYSHPDQKYINIILKYCY